VSTRFGTLDSFDDTTQTFDSNTTSFDDNDIVIPPIAFKTRINVPPPGEIKVTRGTLINAFDQNFITFDNANNTYDEDGTQGTYGTHNASFDNDTGSDGTFDSGTITFDTAPPQKSFDTNQISFDSNTNTLDETL
jgi:hypothetical protein